jgi:hypothetical protein
VDHRDGENELIPVTKRDQDDNHDGDDDVTDGGTGRGDITGGLSEHSQPANSSVLNAVSKNERYDSGTTAMDLMHSITRVILESEDE